MTSGPAPLSRADAELHPVIERIAGSSVELELLYWPVSGPEGECCGGYLNVGNARLWLDPDHASNLADRVRTAIDQAVLSNFPAPTQERKLS